jgi:multidrug efflux system outer membrane protein
MLTRPLYRKDTLKTPILRVVACLLILPSCMLPGCARTEVREPVRTEMVIPETFSIYEETVPALDRWWMGFESSELDRLIDDALQGSLTLRASPARLEQSRALALQAGADRLPDLDVRAGASETWRNSDSETVTSRSRNLTLVSSYEIDFWGRIAAEERSALLEFEASREDLYTAALTLASEITIKWLELISVRRQMELLQEQRETNQTILDLMELRYLNGMATALDIYQQRQAGAETEASFPPLESRLQTLLHDLAVLAGKPPRSDLELVARAFPASGPYPETGVPADLLSKRPDIRAAGLKLRAAEGQADAARMGRLPTVNLTASAGFSSQSFSDLLENWIASLAANLTYTIFDSGSERAGIKRQEAVVEERLASYEETVLSAIREVENAMIREVKQAEYVTALEKQLEISRNGLREAESRYRKGLSDYLPVLASLTSTHRLQRSIVQAKFDRLAYRVALYRALGGGWMEEELKGKVEIGR